MVDPKNVEFEEFRDKCHHGYIIHTFEDFKSKFEILKELKSNKIVIINEIADFIYDEDHYNDFKNILLYIKNSSNISFIVCTQRSIYVGDYKTKLDFILKDDSIIKFIF